MTLGQAPEALAIGYLRNQRLVRSIEEIAAVQVDWETDSVAVTTRKGVKGLGAKMKKRTVTTGCGQGTVFGDLMEEIESISLRDDVRLAEDTLYALLDAVRRHETIYKAAGAVHGCALATNAPGASEILTFVEDVGRHNAVDAIAGQMWLDGHRRLGQDLLHHRAPHLRDGDQVRADADPVPRLALRADPDGLDHRDEASGSRCSAARSTSTTCCSPAGTAS